MRPLSGAYSSRDLVYVEPFAGSAALFFEIKPKSAILADLNGHLINALTWVRDEPEEMYHRVSFMERTSENYYRNRLIFNQINEHTIEAAVLFVFLNRNCFNGLWRTNKSGKFNVPYGGTEMGTLPPLDLFMECSESLKRAVIKHQDFRDTILGCGSGCFIYADPPYFTAGERTFIEYGKKSFGQKDLEDLTVGLVEAAHRGAKVSLTYSDIMPMPNIPETWFKKNIEITRNVGGFAGSRKRNVEILYTSYEI